MDSVLRMTAIAALLSSLGGMVPAHAGLGPIKVLSSDGEPFEAEIPLVDEAVGANALIGLADRNRYPLISPYTPSAGKLQFSLVQQADGTLSKVRVAGPANFDEPTLHFAVEISWPAGRLVREFDVDYRRDGPRHPKRHPLPDDEGKKAAVTADHHARLTPLGLGELKVQSFIGQPLLAEVEVLGQPHADHKQLSAVVLPSRVVGVQQAQLLASIGYEFVKSASGKTVLRLFSSQIVEERMLSLRLEVGVGTIKLARSYSLFFDPPEIARLKGHSSRGEAADVTHHAAMTKVYQVGRGDTLGAIAQRTEGGGTVEQVIRRLHAANPQAFIAGDVDRLKAGAKLAYPVNWRIAEAAPAGNKVAVKEHSTAPAQLD
ncbi:MAG TPA: pilus assembly protein FimV, partial [Pseudogulbenkiania sp.]|nr:pilus assembly protein FimV [Pseudogulbenkiania sp.]